MTSGATGYIAALDVGERRIGVALAHSEIALAKPFATIPNDAKVWTVLKELIEAESIVAWVIGLPRGLEGQETAQTAYCRQFAEELRQRLNVPTYFQDESLTSVNAEAALHARGKGYNKEMIDAWAATTILEDFLTDTRSNHGTLSL